MNTPHAPESPRRINRPRGLTRRVVLVAGLIALATGEIGLNIHANVTGEDRQKIASQLVVPTPDGLKGHEAETFLVALKRGRYSVTETTVPITTKRGEALFDEIGDVSALGPDGSVVQIPYIYELTSDGLDNHPTGIPAHGFSALPFVPIRHLDGFPDFPLFHARCDRVEDGSVPTTSLVEGSLMCTVVGPVYF